MNERLGLPDRRPHGWPISPDDERAENEDLKALSDLDARAACELLRPVEHDDDGFVPGTKLAVLDVQPAAGHLKVRTGSGEKARERLIAEQAAAGDRARLPESPQGDGRWTVAHGRVRSSMGRP